MNPSFHRSTEQLSISGSFDAGVSVASPESPIPPGWRPIIRLALVFGVLLALVHSIQLAGGAQQAAFGEFPDEPAHYVGGLVARDYLSDAFGKDPFSYVRDYHVHLPFFALGVWPPFFYFLEGCWMAVFGHDRASMLWMIAASAAGLGTLLFSMLRREWDSWTSIAYSAIFLLIPVVQWSACLVMADLTCSLFALAAILYFARFLERERWQDAALFGCFCGISLLTKNSTYYIVLVPPVVLAATGRWNVLRRRALWLAPVLAASIYLPWLWVSRPFLLLGTHGLQLPGFWSIQGEYLKAIWQETSFVLPAGLAGGLLVLYRDGRKASPVVWCALAIIPAISVGIFFARVPIQPRLLMVAYVALIFLAAQLCGLLTRIQWRVAVMLAVLGVFGASNWMRFHRLRTNDIRPVVAFIEGRDAGSPGAVIVPSDREGSWIAEFAQQESVRPHRILLRPTKVFGEEDWNGTNWRPYYTSTGEIEALFQRLPAKYCILSSQTSQRKYLHDALLKSVVAANPESWRLVFETKAGKAPQFRIYENRRWNPAGEAAVYAELIRMLPKNLR